MDNRVYYGQYSLKHWIDLILKENITLPGYQRHFVWKEEDVKQLIIALKNNQFVPPITIGSFKQEDMTSNLILDGQQRLTSILLAYLGYFPSEKKYRAKKGTIENFADENDDEIEEEDDEVILEWTFKAITQEGKNKQTILESVKEPEYKKIEFEITEQFLNETYLGFSYLVPNAADDKQQQKYYSTVFRSINNQGKPLLAQESRASLYFLDKDLVNFFTPDFIKNTGNADFVRYMSLLSQYAKDGNSNKIARGFKPYMESYYEKYIYSVTGGSESPLFVNFSKIFPNKEFKDKFEILKSTLAGLALPKHFSSIIELDMYLFGLIYVILFRNRKIDLSRKDSLKKELENAGKSFKENYNHAKAPSALKYLKDRIDTSIQIVYRYVLQHS